MGGDNLISSDLAAQKIYLHSGFGTTIDTEIADPASGSVVSVTWGLDENLYSATYSDGRIHKHSGFSTTISDSFLSGWTSGLRGITIDQNGNIISVRRASHKTIYLHDGFSSSTTDSFVTPTSDPHGVTWDGTDLYYCDPGAGAGGVAKIHKMVGFSSTVDTSFDFGGTSSVYDISWDGTNLYSEDDDTDDLVKHVGFSATADTTINSPSTTPYGLGWHNANARLGVSTFIPKMIILF
jgi:hypothetical protein